ncbi:peptidase M20 domain-containing protein 2-like [Genypterus blacodes]|uniref:peptidase M20 domain-containing protein 2-like n=1 Tax=Genypterus blacodes TaxID=154954 RepID=UPI003F76CC98
MEKQRIKDAISSSIDRHRDRLSGLSRDIWSCPELALEERQAHDTMVRFFSEDQSWTVESRYKLPTAFRATWTTAGGADGDLVVNVAFLCEYDALPGIGHACGHNLIAEVGAAAALGLKSGLEEHQPELPVRVKITVLGTPAEESKGGKIALIEAGAFDDIDVVLMAHPVSHDASAMPFIAIADVTVKYHGKACHASAFPWEGLNALDAAVLAYNNLSVLRQQLKPDWRLHGVIKHGGVKPSIIPDYTEMEFYLRTPLLKDLCLLKAKAEACFRAAAQATGCQVEILYPNPTYYNILPNPTLESLYENNGKSVGIQFEEPPNQLCASTDFGNVSFIIPGIHPVFYIGTDALNHSEDYTAAAGAEEAQFYTLRAAKALAMTAADVLCCPDLLKQVRDDFTVAKLKQET